MNALHNPDGNFIDSKHNLKKNYELHEEIDKEELDAIGRVMDYKTFAARCNTLLRKDDESNNTQKYLEGLYDKTNLYLKSY